MNTSLCSSQKMLCSFARAAIQSFRVCNEFSIFLWYTFTWQLRERSILLRHRSKGTFSIVLSNVFRVTPALSSVFWKVDSDLYFLYLKVVHGCVCTKHKWESVKKCIQNKLIFEWSTQGLLDTYLHQIVSRARSELWVSFPLTSAQ